MCVVTIGLAPLITVTQTWLYIHSGDIAGAEQKIVADWQAEKPAEPVFNSLIQASGKLVLIDKLLPKLKESGHKVRDGKVSHSVCMI